MLNLVDGSYSGAMLCRVFADVTHSGAMLCRVFADVTHSGAMLCRVLQMLHILEPFDDTRASSGRY